MTDDNPEHRDQMPMIIRSSANEPPRLTPGSQTWTMCKLLAVASRDCAFTGPDRRRIARELIEHSFTHPVHRRRWQYLQDRGVESEELRERAAEILMTAVWEAKRKQLDWRYTELETRILNRLNEQLTKDVLGPDERKIRRLDERDPPASLERLQAEGAEFEGPDVRFGQVEARLTLRALIERAELTDGQREAVRQRELYGRSPEQAAEKMDSTPGSVRVLHCEAMGRLEEEVG